MRRITGCFGILILLAGCSLYNAFPLPRDELSRSPFRHNGQSVLTIVQPLDLVEDTNEYFHADLLGEGILPFYVLILNAGNDRIRLTRDQILLAYKGDEPLVPMSAGVVASKLASSKIAALKLGTMGIAIALWTDYNRSHDYLKKEFPSIVEIAPHEGIDGVLFFQLNEPLRDALGSTLYFTFKNLDTLEDRTFNLSIHEAESPRLTSGNTSPLN